MVYRIDNFTENRINPITSYEYDESWLVLMLTDSDVYKQCVGSNNECAYTVKISRRMCDNWMMDVGDFIHFYDEQGKNLIVVMSEDEYITVQNFYIGHKHDETFLRDYEPAVLMPSMLPEQDCILM